MAHYVPLEEGDVPFPTMIEIYTHMINKYEVELADINNRAAELKNGIADLKEKRERLRDKGN
jgi:predicted  nucleic acid-binding Zn-ribbon protein